MQPARIRSFVNYSLLLTWIALCVWFYVRYPGSISNIYGSSLADWSSFLFKLQRINLPSYAATISTSVIEALFFSLSSTFAGTFLLVWLRGDFKEQTHSTISWLASFWNSVRGWQWNTIYHFSNSGRGSPINSPFGQHSYGNQFYHRDSTGQELIYVPPANASLGFCRAIYLVGCFTHHQQLSCSAYYIQQHA